jgi:hypothetical protein
MTSTRRAARQGAIAGAPLGPTAADEVVDPLNQTEITCITSDLMKVTQRHPLAKLETPSPLC